MQKWIYTYRKSGFCLIFLLPLALNYSQASLVDPENSLGKIYTISQEKYGIDQQLANGEYFENIYRTAIGHPYILEDEFSRGTIVYCNKVYKNVEIKFDTYTQQVLINHQHHDFPMITILTDEFLSSFDIYGMEFRKIVFKGHEPAFYQIIEDTGMINCYYHWFKIRKESIKDDKTLIYSFSSRKRRSYILMDDVLTKYNRNRSFLNLFPDEFKVQIKNYQRINRIKVKKASDKEMKELIDYCQDLLYKRKVG